VNSGQCWDSGLVILLLNETAKLPCHYFEFRLQQSPIKNYQ
jgi:hypothetical protein